MSEKYTRTAAKPLLLVLPGLDGSGITAWTQFPELALDYELRAMQIPADDRTSYEALVDLVAKEVNDEKDNNRDVLLFGESMGAGVALDAARRAPPSALVLCSPATGWDRTWLGKLRFWLVTLPDALLEAFITLIPKDGTDGGPRDLRPITVTSALYRLWAAARVRHGYADGAE